MPTIERPMPRAPRLALLALLVCAPAAAQVAPAPDAIYHGLLDVVPAGGKIDPETGDARIEVRRWRFLLAPASNGIYPDLEPILVAIGEDSPFVVEAGLLRRSRNGGTFSYRAPRGTGPRGVKRVKIKLLDDGSYGARLTLAGIDLSRLVVVDPVCLPMAIIVGDDDFFSGVNFTRTSFSSRRVRLPTTCEPDGIWPWA